MNAERKAAWLRAFGLLSQVWSFLEPTVDRIRVFDAALSDLEPEEIEYGVAWILANYSGKQNPVPGDIRDAVQGPLVRAAVTRVDGRIVRWEQRRLRPAETQHAPVLALRSLHGQEAPAHAALGDRRGTGVLPSALRLE